VRVKAWSNGSARPSGAGYGLRVSLSDRDEFFDERWDSVEVDLGEYGRAAVPLSASFWGTCTELRSAAIGRWLIGHHLAPWRRGTPPTVELEHVTGNVFRLHEPRR
jgi:hypothetical protein